MFSKKSETLNIFKEIRDIKCLSHLWKRGQNSETFNIPKKSEISNSFKRLEVLIVSKN